MQATPKKLLSLSLAMALALIFSPLSQASLDDETYDDGSGYSEDDGYTESSDTSSDEEYVAEEDGDDGIVINDDGSCADGNDDGECDVIEEDSPQD